MSITEDGMGAADLKAVLGNNDGFGGNNGAWWLLILLFALNGGWGNGFGYGGGGGGAFPWMMAGQNNTQNDVQRGFDQNAIMTALGNIQQGQCTGFGGVTQAMQAGFAAAEAAASARQMADMNQAFQLQSQLAQCCCENRLATANLNSTIISENCADREALNSIGRDIIAAVNANTQSIKDQLCQDKIDAKNDTIAQLRSELLFARGQASQDVQTAAIQAGQRTLANEIEQYVAPKAYPAYLVQNPNCCAQTYACGCGA
jgi:hypothetical protein